MVVNFNRKFLIDLKKFQDKKLKKNIKTVITSLENASEIKDVNNVVKIKGHALAYRIRIEDFRMGLYYENGEIEMNYPKKK